MPTENSATEDYPARHAQSGHRDASELTAFGGSCAGNSRIL